MQAPTTNRITQGVHGQYNAVDYSASPDNRIYAPESGKITAYGASGTCGNRLELTAGSNRHGFCHLERSLVSVGQNVSKGQAIGIMGYTGYTIPSGPAGTHLHWVINRGGSYVYPPSLVNEQATQGGQIMDTDAKVRAQYYTLRGSEGTDAERKGWIGRSYEEFNATARAEVNARETHRRNLENAIGVLTSERDAARAQATKLSAEVLAERDKVKKLEAQVSTLTAELEGAKQAYEELKALNEAQIAEINKTIQVKEEEIVRLQKELDSCNNSQGDLADKTGLELIILGIKKLFGRS